MEELSENQENYVQIRRTFFILKNYLEIEELSADQSLIFRSKINLMIRLKAQVRRLNRRIEAIKPQVK